MGRSQLYVLLHSACRIGRFLGQSVLVVLLVLFAMSGTCTCNDTNDAVHYKVYAGYKLVGKLRGHSVIAENCSHIYLSYLRNQSDNVAASMSNLCSKETRHSLSVTLVTALHEEPAYGSELFVIYTIYIGPMGYHSSVYNKCQDICSDIFEWRTAPMALLKELPIQHASGCPGIKSSVTDSFVRKKSTYTDNYNISKTVSACNNKVECIQCGVGYFWDSITCTRCTIGTYQDKTGQTYCKQCPHGTSTNKFGSTSIEECIEGITVSDEKRLIKDLLDYYAKVGIIGRPVRNTSDTVRVEYGLGLIQILDLDEKDQVLTTNCWARYIWHDTLLTWEPKQYGGITEVRVPHDQVWTPDIVLYNFADDRLEEKRKALVVVTHDGGVLWVPTAIFKSTCSIDITHFPFDQQTCKMKFGSWTYNGNKLDIWFYQSLAAFSLDDYIPSNEWEIISSPAVRNVMQYPCCEEPYPDLTFHLTLRRKVAFYSYILVLPCVLLSSLTLVLFWLPPESPAKMVLGMNIFVAFFLLLLLLSDLTPPASSSVPLIGAYFCLNMIMITLSTFLSVIVINLYFRQDKKNKCPEWLKRIMLDGFARVLCMRKEVFGDEPVAFKKVKVDKKEKERRKYKIQEMKYNKYQMCETNSTATSNGRGTTGFCTLNHYENGPTFMSNDSKTPDKSPVHMHHSMESDVKDIRRCLRNMTDRLVKKDAMSRIATEWRTVALVLDRLFFFMYLIIIVVSVIVVFPREPSRQ